MPASADGTLVGARKQSAGAHCTRLLPDSFELTGCVRYTHNTTGRSGKRGVRRQWLWYWHTWCSSFCAVSTASACEGSSPLGTSPQKRRIPEKQQFKQGAAEHPQATNCSQLASLQDSVPLHKVCSNCANLAFAGCNTDVCWASCHLVTKLPHCAPSTAGHVVQCPTGLSKLACPCGACSLLPAIPANIFTARLTWSCANLSSDVGICSCRCESCAANMTMPDSHHQGGLCWVQVNCCARAPFQLLAGSMACTYLKKEGSILPTHI